MSPHAQPRPAAASGVLSMWTVYDHPTDYPDEFVARRFEIAGKESRATEELLRRPTLEALREALPPWLHRLPRDAKDDPCIVEIWM